MERQPRPLFAPRLAGVNDFPAAAGLCTVLAVLLVLFLPGCFQPDNADDDGRDHADGPTDDDSGDDDSGDDSDDDSGDDTFDDDLSDDDSDDDGDDDTDSTPSLNFGLVDYHYYFDLGGYDGSVFLEDTAWLADNVELAIIGYGDLGMDWAWEALREAHPRGHWLKWRLAQLIATHETAGSCADPRVGIEHPLFDSAMVELADFLVDHPEYGDGESCFLHARHDGTIRARWHAAGCDIDLEQKGIEDSATDWVEARLFTLVFDDYAWLIDMASDCGRDFIAHRSIADVVGEGFGGVGFDNIGGQIGDGYYLPEEIDDIDIIEVPDTAEASPAALDTWWTGVLDGFIDAVSTALRAQAPNAFLLYNSAAYCSWDTSVPRLVATGAPGVGVWCESAIQSPSWGTLNTPERLDAFGQLCADMADAGGIVALETFYDGGTQNPSADELMFYLAAYYTLGDAGTYLVIKPDWDPYEPLKNVTWFPILGFDIGAPSGPYSRQPNGVFTRAFVREDGMRTTVVVRGDGQEAPVSYTPAAPSCRIGADAAAEPVSGPLSLSSGDGWILVTDGTGSMDCGAR